MVTSGGLHKPKHCNEVYCIYGVKVVKPPGRGICTRGGPKSLDPGTRLGGCLDHPFDLPRHQLPRSPALRRAGGTLRL
jgi:hypothetical protein